MAQPQHQMPPQRNYSPAAHPPTPSQMSPTQNHPHLGHAPAAANKRPGISAAVPLPSPQPQSPYTTSPGTRPMPLSAGSPISHPTATSAAQSYHTPQYYNGHAVSPVPVPLPPQAGVSSQYHSTPTAHTPQLMSGPTTPSGYAFSNATLAPFTGHNTPSVMGPPSKPAERAVKEYRYDVDDSLAGTGINLDQEEQILADYYAGKYRPEAVTGLPANPPGTKASFYGAGTANQPGQPVSAESKVKSDLAAAKKAWTDAAKNLAITRSNELHEPFVQTHSIHFRAHKIAREYGLDLNEEMKEDGQRQKLANPAAKPTIIVETRRTPDGAMITTCGSLIPRDAQLSDQMALLSIAVRYRLRGLLEDSNRIAVTRQMTGVPEEWVDAAAPVPKESAAPRAEDESAVSPGANSLKRPFDAMSSAALDQEVAKIGTSASDLTTALVGTGKAERDLEESRLRKRQRRAEKAADPESASRSGSVAPGTPGIVAPEPEKAPTKKELKAKSQAASKLAEQDTTKSANRTSLAFLGGFGKKKGKQYSWMQAGSGAGTPARVQTPGTPATPSAGGTPRPAAPSRLTMEGRQRFDVFPEDGEKGKNIQLRDWVVALETDGHDIKALQAAYDKLDASNPK